MCRFQTLYCCPDGYVIYCRHCHQYRVAFMCLYLTFAGEDFTTFRKVITDEYNRTDYIVKNYVKNIVVRTPSQGIAFIFSKYELLRFHEILEAADSELQALTLMGMFGRKK